MSCTCHVFFSSSLLSSCFLPRGFAHYIRRQCILIRSLIRSLTWLYICEFEANWAVQCNMAECESQHNQYFCLTCEKSFKFKWKYTRHLGSIGHSRLSTLLTNEDNSDSASHGDSDHDNTPADDHDNPLTTNQQEFTENDSELFDQVSLQVLLIIKYKNLLNLPEMGITELLPKVRHVHVPGLLVGSY